MVKIITVPKNILLPVFTILCTRESYSFNNRMFDALLMIIFEVVRSLRRRHGYSVAPMTLALVLGGMMDSNFRRAISLAVSEDYVLNALFMRPITLILLILTITTTFMNVPMWKKKERDYSITILFFPLFLAVYIAASTLEKSFSYESSSLTSTIPALI